MCVLQLINREIKWNDKNNSINPKEDRKREKGEKNR